MPITEKEFKEEFEELGKNFNIVSEMKDYNYLASRRIEISRVWAQKLLKISFYLNIATIILIIVTIGVMFMKPTPDFYATTPSGKIFHLLKVK